MNEVSNEFMATYPGLEDFFPEQKPLAHAYVPMQPYMTPMEDEQSLVCGTAFENLVEPYCAGFHLYEYEEEASEV